MQLSNLSAEQLRRAADIKEQIDALQEQLNAIMGGEISTPLSVAPPAAKTGRRKKRRKLSAEGLANIRAGVQKRMAKQTETTTTAEKPAKQHKRKMSAAAKARLSEAAKARWEKAKAEGRSKL